MPITPQLTDGDFSELTEIEGAAPAFPFLNSVPPDRHARTHTRRFEVDRSAYVPAFWHRDSVTNLLTYSEDFTNAAWTKNSGTAAANIRANPSDGSTTMGRLLEVAATAEHSLSRAYTFTAALHTLFVHVAPGLGRDWLRLKAADGTTDFTCFFDLVNGRVGTAANCTGEIVALDDGSFLCAIAFTPAAAVGSITLNVATADGVVSYAGDTAKGLYFWGAQLQLGARGAYVATTTASRTALVPLVDREDPFALLADESRVEAGEADVLKVTRVFARIPRQQLSFPGSRYITFPTPVNRYGSGDYLPAYDLEFNQALGQGYYQAGAIWTSADRRLYQAKAITATTVGRATAGTMTLTYGASTTAALAYNASAGTIETALNALASASSDGVTFAVTNDLATVGRLWIRPALTSVPAGWPKKVTMDATGLTVTTSKNPVTAYQNSTNQFIYLPDHHTITGHSFTTSNRLALVVKSNTLTVLPSGAWGSIDANTIWAPTAGVTGIAYAGDYKRLYEPGSILVTTRIAEDFALPDFTVGIATPADIAVPDGCQLPEVLFPALVGASGWQPYDSAGPATWMGPIHRLATTYIDLDDV
jgi:hypothetical protein